MIFLIKYKNIEIDEKIFYRLKNEDNFFASLIFQKKFFKSENNNYFINYLDKIIIKKNLHLNDLEIYKNTESNFIKNFFAEFIMENTINFWTLNEIFFIEKIDFLKNFTIIILKTKLMKK